MNIYFVRHGITDWNLQRRAQGLEEVPLNEGGILQAHACGEQLQGLSVDYIVSSPLGRAVQTAEIVGSYLGINDVHTMEQFTERDFGRLSGLTKEEADVLRASGEDMLVESKEAVAERCRRGVEELYQRFGAESILVVTHGGLIRSLLRDIMDEKDVPEFLINCGVSLVHYEEGEMQAGLLNLPADVFLREYKKRL